MSIRASGATDMIAAETRRTQLWQCIASIIRTAVTSSPLCCPME
jgi:hypothetical protein